MSGVRSNLDPMMFKVRDRLPSLPLKETSATTDRRYRLSEVESERRRAMAPFVAEKRSGFYSGRELKIPER